MRRVSPISLLFIFLLALFGCSNTGRSQETIPDDYTIGVVRTIGYKNSSDILYFDDELKQTGITHYDYATMGELFYSPIVYDGSLYIVPQGQANKKDEKTVLQLDLDSFEQQEYSLDQIAIYGLSVNSSAIFAANNINQQSFISRIDRTNETVKTAAYNDLYISIVCSYQDKLYAFSSESTPSGIKSTLHCLDPITLEELQRIDISEFGSGVYSVVGVGNVLYFVPSVTPQDTFNHIVCAYNTSSEEIRTIEFPYNVFHVLNADNKLYVTHGNLVTGEGTALSVFEIETEKMDTYDLGMWPGQIAINDKALYVVGTDTVAKFDLQTMDRQAEASIPLNDGYYLSSLFSK